MTRSPAPPSADRDAEGDGAAAMVREMEAHLETIRVASRGSRRRELEALFLLALEREELAAVGYGGEGIHERVAHLDTDDATRAVVAYALRWAARDERTHAVLARGLLVKAGRRRLAIARLGASVGGWIAGWSAAVVTHTTFRRAPLSRIAARAIVILGRIAGKVPDTAAKALEHRQSFAAFCAFQVGAERTAILSWDHLARVLEGDAKLAALAATAARIANDERKHEKVLEVLRAAFDDADRLRDGWDAARLADALRGVDPAFVRGGDRKDRLGAVGSGGAVVVRESVAAASGDDAAIRALLRDALDASGALPASDPLGDVAIKVEFMLAYDARDPSSHVDRVLTEELARLLRERGATDVALIEAPNHFDHFFSGRGVDEVARYLGFESDSYRVVDSREDQVPHAFRRGIGQDGVCRTWRDADTRIVLAKMRTHPSMLVHLSTSALESLGKRIEELLFDEREADVASVSMMMIDAFPPDLAILDATHHVPDGLTGILGDPKPCHPGRVYVGRDPIALDLVAARHMGTTRFPPENPIALALDWFDDPRPRTRVDGPDTAITGLLSPHRNDLTVLLSTLAYPVYVFMGDRGSLWMPRMDPEAFPPKRRPTILEWMIRPLLRGLFGFGKPARLPRATR